MLQSCEAMVVLAAVVGSSPPVTVGGRIYRCRQVKRNTCIMKPTLFALTEGPSGEQKVFSDPFRLLNIRMRYGHG